MNEYSHSNERSPLDLFQFGLAFAGFILGAAGTVTASPFIAVLGGLLMGLGIWYFFRHQGS